MRLMGIVKHHLGRGKALGYPTANLDVQTDIPEALYLGWAIYQEMYYKALIFIGRSLTFRDHLPNVEVYILDFNDDIYNQPLSVEILQKLRDNIQFNTKEELVQQMKKDEQDAREFFKSRKPTV